MAQPVRQCRVAVAATDQGTEANPRTDGVWLLAWEPWSVTIAASSLLYLYPLGVCNANCETATHGLLGYRGSIIRYYTGYRVPDGTGRHPGAEARGGLNRRPAGI